MENNPPYQSVQSHPKVEDDVSLLSDLLWDGFRKSKELVGAVVAKTSEVQARVQPGLQSVAESTKQIYSQGLSAPAVVKTQQSVNEIAAKTAQLTSDAYSQVDSLTGGTVSAGVSKASSAASKLASYGQSWISGWYPATAKEESKEETFEF